MTLSCVVSATVWPEHDDASLHREPRRRQRSEQHGVGRRRYRALRLQKLVRYRR